jgi:hypothetical protein
MTSHDNTVDKLKPVAGGTLVGLGIHILAGNLDGTIAQLRQIFDTTGGATLGVLPSGVLAASQAVQVYASNRQLFAEMILQALISLWPLLLVIAGVVLLRDLLTDKINTLPMPAKYFQNSVPVCRFRCPSFDV